MDFKYSFLLELAVSTLPFLAMLACYFFCFWLPRHKNQEEEAFIQESIRLGDTVVTKSGISGMVIDRQKDVLIIKSCDTAIRVKVWGIKEKL